MLTQFQKEVLIDLIENHANQGTEKFTLKAVPPNRFSNQWEYYVPLESNKGTMLSITDPRVVELESLGCIEIAESQMRVLKRAFLLLGKNPPDIFEQIESFKKNQAENFLKGLNNLMN